METQEARPIDPVWILVCGALVLFWGIGLAAILGWVPGTGKGDVESTIQSRLDEIAAALVIPRPVPHRAAGHAKLAASCGRCGVIESVREVERPRNVPGAISIAGTFGRDPMAVLNLLIGAMLAVQTGKNSGPDSFCEITVRFNDGSSRVLTEANPPAWKPGDRVKVINGRILPGA